MNDYSFFSAPQLERGPLGCPISLRRLRGLVGASLMWAVLWVPLGILFGVVRYLRTPPSDVFGALEVPPRPPALPIIAGSTIGFAVWGAIVGFIFAVTLLAAERKRTLQQLSARRMALWGAVAAAALPVAVVVIELTKPETFLLEWRFIFLAGIAMTFGAACAFWMVRLAQRGAETWATRGS